MSKSVVWRIAVLVITAILAGVSNWLFLPAITFASGGFWVFCITVVIIATVLIGLVEYILDDDTKVFTIILSIITALLIVVSIIVGCTSWQCFHANSYRSLVNIEEGDFSADITDESMNLIVDVDTAKRLGDRTIGAIENSSWYEVDDEWNLCEINGEYCRISPLNYAGLFKYNKASSNGIPGFVKVNAQTQEAEFVELAKTIKYSPSGYFSKNLTRHLRNEYASYQFGKSFFEVDDEGTAYYVTAVQESEIGAFGGKIVKSVIITDANTGECTEYNLDEIPNWVDHVYSVEYLTDLAYYYYQYVEGFINFSETGVYKTSYYYATNSDDDSDAENFVGYNTTITSDGIVFYTGLSPANTAEANVGFLTMNPRTGEIKYYPCSGAEESSAQSAAEGLVQNMNYTASFPTIVNIDGEETYFMLLKDKQGLIQRYALCNVENYSIVVQSTSLEDVKKQYIHQINGESIPTSNTTEETETLEKNLVEVEGVISELYEVSIDGNTTYIFKLDSNENIYVSSIKNNYMQVTLSKGMIVKLSCYKNNNVYIVDAISF